jgi:flagellar protein FlbD
MIQLTRLNNQPFLMNPDLIKWIENAPDTVLTLVTGEKVVVSESSSQIVERIVEFRRRLFPGLALGGLRSVSAERSEGLLLRPEER